jgi:glucans biosynthesis protein
LLLGAVAAAGPMSRTLAAVQEDAGERSGFDANQVRALARELARKPYKSTEAPLPSAYASLKYDGYRDIRFRPDLALWRGENLPFQVQFFHRGFIYGDKVDISIVSDGRTQAVKYSPDLFTFGKLAPPPPTDDLGFAGFRLHAKINRPDYYDEVAVFLGASYFRAVAKGQVYGLSARGLSIRTADPKGEEYPRFTRFWIERPASEATSIVVHALLDSESATAAFRFTIRPGEETIFDTEMSLYPRSDIAEAGIGSSTTMFLFDANDRAGFDDFRPAVHDSDGLAIRNGRNEEIWRPLTNPKDLQVSVFSDLNPRGFGLMQRERDFFAYEDLESHFEERPSLWVEPIGDWGPGGVFLVEIPTNQEIHDNIVAFWRPKEPLKANSESSYTYRLHWTYARPNPGKLATFAKTRTGTGPSGTRRFVLELVGNALFSVAPNAIQTTVSASKGAIQNLVLQRNPETGGMRVSFELDPKGEPLIEMRAVLMHGDVPLSETWLYRWTK